MNKAYCTIVTHDHLHFALALNSSLLAFNTNIQFKVLVADQAADGPLISSRYPNVQIFNASELCITDIAKTLYNKYAKGSMDRFRWSMKPVFINYLLTQGYEQVFFLDPDTFFFSSFDLLSDELAGNSVLLTPHWRASNPKKDPNNFAVLQTMGLFNAGFVGASKSGMKAMTWWADTCAFRCEKRPDKGFYDDQGYLNLMPIYFENVQILRHRGCNIANWNQVECQRVQMADGNLKINGLWDIIFIHFTISTIHGIKTGQDVLLRPYLKKYLSILEKFKVEVKALLAANHNQTKPALPVVTETVIKPDGQNFVYPRLIATSIDIYHIRVSILTTLKAMRSSLHGTLLDVGCGQMPYKSLLTSPPSRVTQYIGLDFKDNPIHDNQPDITWQDGKIPIPESVIDCAIATEVFEHCPDPEAVMHEIFRVFKPGGLLFFTVPFLWPLHEVPYDQYRYTPFALRRHLDNCGFSDITIKAMGGWDASLAQMLGLWVRRRKMNRWPKGILSILFMPVIYMLFKNDKKSGHSFQESSMLTGIFGTARKSPMKCSTCS